VMAGHRPRCRLLRRCIFANGMGGFRPEAGGQVRYVSLCYVRRVDSADSKETYLPVSQTLRSTPQDRAIFRPVSVIQKMVSLRRKAHVRLRTQSQHTLALALSLNCSISATMARSSLACFLSVCQDELVSRPRGYQGHWVTYSIRRSASKLCLVPSFSFPVAL
jgi:hypothetical protein